MPLTINNQPDPNCIVSKKGCETICVQNTDLVKPQGTQANVSFLWIETDVGATGTILDKEFTLGIANTGTTFDGTIEGFQIMLEIAFPEYLGGDFVIIQDTTAKVVVWFFPENAEVSNFIFAPNAFVLGVIASNATNGTNPIISNCEFDVRMYDSSTNEEICKLDSLDPKFSDTTPINTEESCFSQWDGRQELTLPTLNYGDQEIDPTFCKQIYYKITERCEDNEGCFRGTTLVQTDNITVVDSCLTNLEDYCVINNVGTALFMTEIPCVKICEGVQSWLWVCPNLITLDELGVNYIYSVRRTYYDSLGDVIGINDSIAGNTNTAYIIPTGSNYFDNLPIPPPVGISYYTIEFREVTTDTTLTAPVTYQLAECCCDEVLYFQEGAGGLSQICMTAKERSLSTSGDTVCIDNGCECETYEVAQKTSEVIELEALCDEEDTLKAFGKAKKHYILREGEFKRISIKEKNINYEIYEGIPNVSISAKISCE